MSYMAKTVVMTDDLDGSASAETVEFSFGGTDYTIDLSKKNRTAFEKVLKPYIAAAQKTSRSGRRSGPGGRGRGRSRSGSSRDLSAVREWAGQNGYTVSSRGRIPQAVTDAYNAAKA